MSHRSPGDFLVFTPSKPSGAARAGGTAPHKHAVPQSRSATRTTTRNAAPELHQRARAREPAQGMTRPSQECRDGVPTSLRRVPKAEFARSQDAPIQARDVRFQHQNSLLAHTSLAWTVDDLKDERAALRDELAGINVVATARSEQHVCRLQPSPREVRPIAPHSLNQVQRDEREREGEISPRGPRRERT